MQNVLCCGVYTSATHVQETLAMLTIHKLG